MGEGANSSTNHPTAATSGGASAKPTPANNAGGRSGWGDPGFIKGGTTDRTDTGLGHVAARNPDINPMTTGGGEPTCATEDHSFMERKPGGSSTLPGWDMAKHILDP
ncbi:hypothetical protein N7451_012152 [Penicillium sp. IBT 35674x]|nr:hypothetical protein N7451_012152 [Penicillium sp. IBT 35674x]